MYLHNKLLIWFRENRNVNPFNTYQMVYYVSLLRDSFVLLRGHKLKKQTSATKIKHEDTRRA